MDMTEPVFCSPRFLVSLTLGETWQKESILMSFALIGEKVLCLEGFKILFFSELSVFPRKEQACEICYQGILIFDSQGLSEVKLGIAFPL